MSKQEWSKEGSDSEEDTANMRVTMSAPVVYDAATLLKRLFEGQQAAKHRDEVNIKTIQSLVESNKEQAEKLAKLETKIDSVGSGGGGGCFSSDSDEEGPSQLLLIGCYSVFASMYMLVSLVAPFFPHNADRWGIDTKTVGFICACDPLGEVMASFFATYVMGLVGMKNCAVLGMVANGVSSIIFGMAPIWFYSDDPALAGTEGQDPEFLTALFVVMRLINGVATTLTYVAIFTLLCCLQPDKLGEVTARANVLATIGLIVGPPFGGLLYQLGTVHPFLSNLPLLTAFALPFIGCSVILVIPSAILQQASLDGVEDEEEEEEELSFLTELSRMASVLNVTIFTGVFAVVTSMVLSNAIYPILGPHLEPASGDVLQGGDALERHPFGYTTTTQSYIFSSSSVGFLPVSLWIGAASDRRERDFPWMRRCMCSGLLVNMCAYYLMGPCPLMGEDNMRYFETTAAMVTSQLLLGAANAMTLIAAFPYFEGVAVLKGRTALNQEQVIAIAGTWYNAAYSAGCAIGPYVAGLLIDKHDFAETEFYLAFLPLAAVLFMMGEAMLDDGAAGGFFSRTAKAEAALTEPLLEDESMDEVVSPSGLVQMGIEQPDEEGGGEEDEEEEGSHAPTIITVACICLVFIVYEAWGVGNCKEIPNHSVPICHMYDLHGDILDANCRNMSSFDTTAAPTAHMTAAPSAHATAGPTAHITPLPTTQHTAAPTVIHGSGAGSGAGNRMHRLLQSAWKVTQPTMTASVVDGQLQLSTQGEYSTDSGVAVVKPTYTYTTTFVCCGGSSARNRIDC